ncbi:hypothetical protein M3Y99_01931200 [Aphelenchoides fujianensis]|nr:hypothetical protein M3Y99_01931200 [Aphelenchoides fujianensis]
MTARSWPFTLSDVLSHDGRFLYAHRDSQFHRLDLWTGEHTTYSDVEEKEFHRSVRYLLDSNTLLASQFASNGGEWSLRIFRPDAEKRSFSSEKVLDRAVVGMPRFCTYFPTEDANVCLAVGVDNERRNAGFYSIDLRTKTIEPLGQPHRFFGRIYHADTTTGRVYEWKWPGCITRIHSVLQTAGNTQVEELELPEATRKKLYNFRFRHISKRWSCKGAAQFVVFNCECCVAPRVYYVHLTVIDLDTGDSVDFTLNLPFDLPVAPRTTRVYAGEDDVLTIYQHNQKNGALVAYRFPLRKPERLVHLALYARPRDVQFPVDRFL